MKTLLCPQCSCSLLRQLQSYQPTWFCPQCQQSFPYGTISSNIKEGADLIKIDYPSSTDVEERYLTPQECHQFSQYQIRNLEKLNHLKDYFLSAISHELKSPLSHIQMGLDMLSESLKNPGVSPELLQTYVDVIQEEFAQESRLIHSLMTLQQVKAGLYPMERTAIALGTWLPIISQDLAELAAHKGITLGFTVPDDLTVEADRSLLEAIVREMLTHVIHIAPRQSQMMVVAKTTLGRVEIQVIHTSPAHPIQPSLTSQPLAFKSFYQVPGAEPWLHAPTNSDINIGLILAQNLASSMGSIIWVGHTQSETFWMLEMPDTTPRAQAPTPEEMLMGYVAYYVSRGRPVISLNAGALPFTGSVYGYWGYDSEFYSYWRGLQQRSDFGELSLRGDSYNFSEFLGGKCSVGECARCQLPIPLLDAGVADTTQCPCDDTLIQSHHQRLASVAPRSTQVLVLGAAPANVADCQKLFAQNRLHAIFVPGLEHLSEADLPESIDLVVLPQLSPKDSQSWIEKLRLLHPLRQATVLAFSPHAQTCQPWDSNGKNLEDYLLSPYGGDYLAQYLQEACRSRSNFQPATVHWFPGVLQKES
ncbi:sensor histidine kinase [Prochlorothrix hollandica]|uniref:histidine kinase n=1 Tax=Prochlorothrix hollandica PCC 9006 = CALU 1027 TaxID=317619 RepID=A0A0M2Q0Z9_PROHO|nr:HAMP domain-containing sensor histidine kinase [Prochlorothrix hollandica]KKJ00983.1 hypothetical protein PROH_00645 [Prochlorothrix hollandica PCC 9006 = CALU 1027]